jgi:transmembrane sensor
MFPAQRIRHPNVDYLVWLTPYGSRKKKTAFGRAWFVRFCEQEADSATCRHFDQWLRASPEHVRAYLEISAFWQAAGTMKRNVEIDSLVERARAASNVIPLETVGEKHSPPKKGWARRRGFALAACVLLTGVAVGFVSWWQLARFPTYATGIGEQRTISLKDGSTVALNAGTRVQIRFSETARLVDLVVGQALFRVAKDPSRPFIVQSASTRVRAVGTQFDVYQKTTGTVVTVVEGRVSVFTPSAATHSPGVASADAPAVLLSAGQQVTVVPHELPLARHANAAVATAWSQGKLVFESTPLSEVIEEFNRYNRRPLSIDDPQLLQLHISGTFSTTDSAQITRFLTQRFGLVEYDTGEGIRLAPK